MVYTTGMGVNHTAWEKPTRKFVPVLAEAELLENTPTKVVANGEDVVLVRRHGNIHALAATCSHLGGPLPKGTLEDDTIRCPWHGSRFALEDGSVKGGPATYAQQLYETRVVEGQIEVRAATQ
ncbi:MAG: Rieske (2Fe-2S) protein [Chloroflexota bacterium]